MQLPSNGAYLVGIVSVACMGATFVLSKYSKHRKSDKAQEENSRKAEEITSSTGWKSKFLNFSSYRWLASLTPLHRKKKEAGLHKNMLLQEDNEGNPESQTKDRMNQQHNEDIGKEGLCEEILESGVRRTNIENELFGSKLTSSSSTSEWETQSESSSATTVSSSCVSENTVTFELISSLNESDREDANPYKNGDTVSYYHAANSLFLPTEQEERLVELSGKNEAALIDECESCAALKTIELIIVPVEDFCDNQLTETHLPRSDFDVDVTSVCSSLRKSDVTSLSTKDSEHHGAIDTCINPESKKDSATNKDFSGNKEDQLEMAQEHPHSGPVDPQSLSENLSSNDFEKTQSTTFPLSKDTVVKDTNQTIPTSKVPTHRETSCKERNSENSSLSCETVDVENVDTSDQPTESVNTEIQKSCKDVNTDLSGQGVQNSVEGGASVKRKSCIQPLPIYSTGIKVKILDKITTSCGNDEKAKKSNLAEVACGKLDDVAAINDLSSCQTTNRSSAIEKTQTIDERVNTGTKGTTKVDVHVVNVDCSDEKSQDISTIDVCTCDRASRFLDNASGSVADTSPDAIVTGSTGSLNYITTDGQTTADVNTHNAKSTSQRITYNLVPGITAQELYFQLAESEFADYGLTSTEDRMGKAWCLQIMTEEQSSPDKQGNPLHEVHNSILQTVKNICTAVTQTTFLPEFSDLSDLDSNHKEKIEKSSIDHSTNPKKGSGISSAAIITNQIDAEDQLRTEGWKQNGSTCPPDTNNAVSAKVAKPATSDTSKHTDTKERETETAKVQKDCVVFFGSRPGPGVPTVCCLDVQMKVNHADSCSNDMNFVIEDCDTCDVILHIKKLDGLVQEKKIKVYIKVILENFEAGFRRKKVRTKQVTLSNSVSFNTDVVLQHIPRKMLTRGKLLVAVWSANTMESNKKLCGVDIQLGKQMRFGDSSKDVQPLIEKLLSMKGSWLDSSLYLS